MGLDMYLTGRKFFWRNYNQPTAERREDDKRVTNMDVELGYWRKHPDLHGFMVREFGKGKDDCKEIELDAAAIRRVIAAVKAKELPHTEGFFFGSSDKTKAQQSADIKVFESALDWLNAGDSDPFATDLHEGPGFTALEVKPKPETQAETHQRVSRSVHYRGDW